MKKYKKLLKDFISDIEKEGFIVKSVKGTNKKITTQSLIRLHSLFDQLQYNDRVIIIKEKSLEEE